MPSAPEDPRSDLRLVRGVLDRDAQATDEFVGRMRCIPAILRLRNRRLGSPLDDALLQDLAQDVLVALWPKLEQYDGSVRLEAWVYRFCTNKHFALVRDRGLRIHIERPSALPMDEHHGKQPAANQTGDTELLHTALAALDPGVAEVVRLKHFEEQTFDQIGERLNVSSNTAKTRYYRALKRLRESIDRRETG